MINPIQLVQAYFATHNILSGGRDSSLDSDTLQLQIPFSLPQRPEIKQTLLAGGTFITFNRTTNDLQIIRDGALLIQGDIIQEIYDHIPLTKNHITVFNTTGKIITPGFISTHNHGVRPLPISLPFLTLIHLVAQRVQNPRRKHNTGILSPAVWRIQPSKHTSHSRGRIYLAIARQL
jgi:hypothetical protein